MSVYLHVEVLELKPHWAEGHRLRASLGRLSIRGNRDLTHSRAAEATPLTGGVGQTSRPGRLLVTENGRG